MDRNTVNRRGFLGRIVALIGGGAALPALTRTARASRRRIMVYPGSRARGGYGGYGGGYGVGYGGGYGGYPVGAYQGGNYYQGGGYPGVGYQSNTYYQSNSYSQSNSYYQTGGYPSGGYPVGGGYGYTGGGGYSQPQIDYGGYAPQYGYPGGGYGGGVGGLLQNILMPMNGPGRPRPIDALCLLE